MSWERRCGPRMLSAVEAERYLAVPVFTILAGIAKPVFPQSSRATPSPVVQIVRVRKSLQLPEVLVCDYPVAVNWIQWKNCVVPVLEDERWGIQNVIVVSAIATGRLSDILTEVGTALRQSFEAAGYSAGGNG